MNEAYMRSGVADKIRADVQGLENRFVSYVYIALSEAYGALPETNLSLINDYKMTVAIDLVKSVEKNIKDLSVSDAEKASLMQELKEKQDKIKSYDLSNPESRKELQDKMRAYAATEIMKKVEQLSEFKALEGKGEKITFTEDTKAKLIDVLKSLPIEQYPMAVSKDDSGKNKFDFIFNDVGIQEEVLKLAKEYQEKANNPNSPFSNFYNFSQYAATLINSQLSDKRFLLDQTTIRDKAIDYNTSLFTGKLGKEGEIIRKHLNQFRGVDSVDKAMNDLLGNKLVSQVVDKIGDENIKKSDSTKYVTAKLSVLLLKNGIEEGEVSPKIMEKLEKAIREQPTKENDKSIASVAESIRRELKPTLLERAYDRVVSAFKGSEKSDLATAKPTVDAGVSKPEVKQDAAVEKEAGIGSGKKWAESIRERESHSKTTGRGF